MGRTTKNKSHDENSIITIFMEEVLESGKDPLNEYSFCKKNSIEETIFYQYFGSIKAIKSRIWVKFYENALQVINENNEFINYTQKDKLLTLYFSLFEIFTLNRSYIIQTLELEKNPFKNISQLKEFREQFKHFVDLNINPNLTNEKLSAITTPVLSEGAWIQFLFTLKFWVDDSSPNFEKTDILIEKSITTSSLLLDSKPLESVFDLAKFLFKEKM